MARIDVNGLSIAYEIIGNGKKNAIITPGGRFSKETPGVKELAQELAKHDFKTVIWDRPNCGESDVSFDAESESILDADAIAGVLKALDMAPALVIGFSGGSRQSLIAAHRHPNVVRKLAVAWISGGFNGLAVLVPGYCFELLVAAKTGGMEAVTKAPGLAECMERNPKNRDRLLAWDVDKFCDTMERWAKSFFPEGGSPVPGLLPADFAAMKMPILIFRSGKADYCHPQFTTDQVHKLIPGSKLVEPPWGDREWIDRIADAQNGLFRRFPLLAPQILEFEKSA
jgi:pimeloyl-ACP methyl ester carboxylesterase